MRNRESLRIWTLVIVILIGTAFLAVLWPAIGQSLGGSFSVPSFEVSTRDIALTLPFVSDTIELNGVVWLLILTAVVVGFVVVTGIVIGFIYLFLARQAAQTKESETFQQHQAALETAEKEKLNQMREGRDPTPIPDYEEDFPRGVAVTTSLILILFVIVVGFLLNSVFVPSGIINVNGSLVASWLLIIGGLLIVTVPIIAWRMRPERVQEVEETNQGPIPWDSIWIILSGLLVVGLGVGLMVYFNIPT